MQEAEGETKIPESKKKGGEDTHIAGESAVERRGSASAPSQSPVKSPLLERGHPPESSGESPWRGASVRKQNRIPPIREEFEICTTAHSPQQQPSGQPLQIHPKDTPSNHRVYNYDR